MTMYNKTSIVKSVNSAKITNVPESFVLLLNCSTLTVFSNIQFNVNSFNFLNNAMQLNPGSVPYLSQNS